MNTFLARILLAVAMASSPVLAGDLPQTVTVLELEPGPDGSYPRDLIVLGNRVIFRASTSEVGLEVFVSDGTAAGTRLLADLRPGPAMSNAHLLARMGDRVYFIASEADGGDVLGLFETDGVSVTRVRTSVRSFLGAVGSRLLVVTRDGDSRLVAFDPRDGSETVLVRSSQLSGSDFGGDGALRVLRIRLEGEPEIGVVTDGTLAGTHALETLPRYPATPYFGSLAFTTEDGRLAITSGGPLGTRYIGLPGGIIGAIAGVAGRLLFFEGGTRTGRLWTLDERGRFSEFGLGVGHDGRQNRPAREAGVVNGRFLFWGGELSRALEGEPFGTDGGKPELLADLVPGPAVWCPGGFPYICSGASLPRDLTPVGRDAYFLGGSDDGMYLWRTDGTAERTFRITQRFGLLRNLVRTPDGLFFGADELVFVPLPPDESVRTSTTPCRLGGSGTTIAPGASTTIAVEGLCGVPVGAYAVELRLSGSSMGRLASAVRLSASGAVPPVESTLLFGKRLTRSTHSVDIGPRGISVHNEGPEAVEISLDVTGYEAPASAPDSR